MLELEDRGRRLLAHVLDRVLVAEPVGALDGVVEVEAPVVLAHVAERGADAALRRHRVAAGREHLGEAGRREALLGEAEGGAQAGAAGADHDDVVGVVHELVGGHAATPKAMRSTASTPMTAATASANLTTSSTATRVPLSRDVILDHDLQPEQRVLGGGRAPAARRAPRTPATTASATTFACVAPPSVTSETTNHSRAAPAPPR